MFPHTPHPITLSLGQIHQHNVELLSNDPPPPLPSPDTLEKSHISLILSLPESGYGLPSTVEHLLSSVAPGLNHSALSPNYYGFVTGGVTPAALCAEILANVYDTNVAVHLPNESVATAVESRALKMLVELFRLEDFNVRILTTGATTANILGLACGREFVVQAAGRRKSVEANVGELGVLGACVRAGVTKIKVLSTRAHSCLGKAASVVGIGRTSLIDVGIKDGLGLKFDWNRLETELQEESSASIIGVSCAEVNTGAFATSLDDMKRLRRLCDKYGAWLHVDAAFGIFARCLPMTAEFLSVTNGVEGIELADSITGDGHKMLNVPYDCGFFFSRHEKVQPQVFQNANAVYLSGGATDIPSPLNMGLENSRRFRGLSVYATLMAYGRSGYADMVIRQIRLARRIADWIVLRDGLELLPVTASGNRASDLFIIILFRADDDELNQELVKRINQGRSIYLSGTVWESKPASRLAVSNWQVDVERDFALVTQVLNKVLTR